MVSRRPSSLLDWISVCVGRLVRDDDDKNQLQLLMRVQILGARTKMPTHTK